MSEPPILRLPEMVVVLSEYGDGQVAAWEDGRRVNIAFSDLPESTADREAENE